MHKADKIGALLHEAYESGRDAQRSKGEWTFEAWLAENGDEILAAVAELAQGVRAQEAAKVRALAPWPGWVRFRGRHSEGGGLPLMDRVHMLNALANDIEDGTL